MKKNILLLINGFGVEQSNSYDVYSPSLMPNMDKLTKEKIFFTIPNTYLDYKSAYRNFSIGINESLTYSLVDNSIQSGEFSKNQLLKYIESDLNNSGAKLHIFCYWDNNITIEHLLCYVNEIRKNIKGKIILHMILCQKDLDSYKDLERDFNKLSYDLGPNVKIGVVTGEKSIEGLLPFKEFIKCFVTEYGEKWKDIQKKINVLLQTKTPPCECRTFAVNYGFMIEDNDAILFFNYANVDVNKYKGELAIQKYRKIQLESIKYYSLFPTISDVQIPFMFNYAVSSNHMLNSLKSINANCLVLDKKDNCTFINYYLTGLRNDVDECIKYQAIDETIYDENKVLEIINSNEKNLFIINYEIDTCKNVPEMLERLSKIDKVIGALDNYTTQNESCLVISSFYGLERDMYNEKQELCKINFKSRVPAIISSVNFNKYKYSANESSSLFDLGNTILYIINNKYNNKGLLQKKSNLLSVFMKKK